MPSLLPHANGDFQSQDLLSHALKLYEYFYMSKFRVNLVARMGRVPIEVDVELVAHLR